VQLHAIDDAAVVIGSLRLVDDAGNPMLRLLPEALVACAILADDPQVRALADLLVGELRGERPGSTLLSGAMAGLLAAAALRSWVERGCAPDGWLSSRIDPDIARVVDAIRDDPGAPWTLDRLARLAHTSRSAFAERFRAAVDDSPARYLTRVRMERAKALLTADRVSVAEAATRSGYGSDAAFSRAFSRHTGVTPSAWRRGLVGAGTGSAA
jgi:AraC-like DNA-binding protein